MFRTIRRNILMYRIYWHDSMADAYIKLGDRHIHDKNVLYFKIAMTNSIKHLKLVFKLKTKLSKL